VSSYSSSRFDPHFSIGYTFADGVHGSNQINYVAGLEVGATSGSAHRRPPRPRFLDTLQRGRAPSPSSRQPTRRGSAYLGGLRDGRTAMRHAEIDPRTVGLKFNPAQRLSAPHRHAQRRRVAPAAAPVLALDYSF
jgi:hypothetical protein